MLNLLKRMILFHSYVANYGYSDGSGDFYVVVDTDKCNSCAKCVEVCPAGVLEMYTDDYDDVVVRVSDAHKKSIKYDCGPCNPTSGEKNAKCEQACEVDAITSSFKIKGSD